MVATTNIWDLGVDANGYPMAWYTPEGYARQQAMTEEYIESGRMARDDEILRQYAADPLETLARAVMVEIRNA